MSKQEIQSWIADANVFQGDSDSDDDSSVVTSGPTDAENNWTTFVAIARRNLLASSTKSRVKFLNEKLSIVAQRGELDIHRALEIFQLLTLTIPRYVDIDSRNAVLLVLKNLFLRDETLTKSERCLHGFVERAAKWMENESTRICSVSARNASATGNKFALLVWICTAFDVCASRNSAFATTSSWTPLVLSLAFLLDSLSDPAMKVSIKKSSFVNVRRALRNNHLVIPSLVKTLIVQSKTIPPLIPAPLIGVGIDVSLRLKPEAKRTAGLGYVAEVKSLVSEYISTSLLMTRTFVPDQAQSAFHDFVQTSVTETDLLERFLPIIEKALLRSPEVSLKPITSFLTAYSHDLSPPTFHRVLSSLVNCAKSSNPIVRTDVIELFEVLISRSAADSPIHAASAIELLALPKANKTTGADHRATLFSMLSHVKPGPDVSPTIAFTLPGLLAKEMNEAAMHSIRAPLSTHLTYVLREGISIPKDVVSSLSKETTSSKVALRRVFFQAVGDTFWALGEDVAQNGKKWSSSATDLSTALMPSLESNVKAAVASPLNASVGPLEGYIAVSIIMRPFSPSSSGRASLHSALALGGSKPSFLTWDKVYGKLTLADDELWLIRALHSAFLDAEDELKRNESLRLQFGLALLHVSIKGVHPGTRRAAIAILKDLTSRSPRLTNQVILDALRKYVSRPKGTSPSPDDAVLPGLSRERLPTVVLSLTTFSESTPPSLRQDVLAELIIITHHEDLAAKSRSLWIEVIQRAQVNPRELVQNKVDSLITNILDSSLLPAFAASSLAAATTLAFVAPDLIVTRLVAQIQIDLDVKRFNGIGENELGIWKTEEGVLYVDVLASKKDTTPNSKGKDRDIEKWEAELRKSIATKKANAAGNLSKQDRALVDTQLRLESQTRKKVQRLYSELRRGLDLIHSLVAAKVDELQEHIWPLAKLLLDGALRRGAALVGPSAVQTYLTIGSSCSPRLGVTRTAIGIATLRSFEIDVVPEDYLAEPLEDLALRILYRVHSLAQTTAFDATTFAYISPFVFHLLEAGGIGQPDEDGSLEQITLALEFIQFHSTEFSSPAYPRLDTLKILIGSMSRYPQLSKSTVPALVDMGQAMHERSTHEETMLLIRGTLAQESYVRNACLQAIQPFDLTDFDWSPELWISCHDDDEQNSRLAVHLWEENALDIPHTFVQDLLPLLAHENRVVRESTARAIPEALDHLPQSIGPLLAALKVFYRDKAKILAPEFDSYGMVIEQSLERLDPWLARYAIAATFEHLAGKFSENEIVPLFNFLIEEEALGDRNADVRRGMLNAGTSIIDVHGAQRLPELLAMFEAHLARPSAPSETADFIREAVVILLGRLARHLEASDPRIPATVDRLVEALKTPSEAVQIAVADCLSPLVELLGPKVGPLVENLLDALTGAPKYAERRGAAYGLSGIVRGRGISSFKEFGIIGRLRAAMDDKKAYEPRQGALFAFETMAATLGRLFEPYIIQILPLLLTAYGDQVPDVREATQDASKVIMANMSGYCVKQVLPSLLGGLDEKQWRTKKGSIELLGAMAFLAPKQLSISLPTIIPRLTGVLTDSHAQVRAAANKSLKQFGEVINNPEVRSLVPVLLKALVDPEKTPVALTALLKKSFVHYIDSPSLALLIPILERGMKERGAETKRKAARIVGNMASLTDSKDFIPYLPRLLPLIHIVLVDPVPEARATSAKALGTLIERLGEVNFPDLVPSLLQTLKTDTSGVDRQGAAQGLSEVLAGLGMDRMEGLLPEIITNANSTRPYVREGFMSLLVFLPATFGHRFAPHLSRIIPPILNGLADAEEYVRAASMKAGRMIIGNYSDRAIDLLLPELERGMFDSSWRIRHSSITLVGELLYKVSGISGKNEIEEDEAGEADAAIAESSRRALGDVLGRERRDRILGSLYIIRQDAVAAVRQASIHIWKALVNNTPRTVREIMPTLIDQIVTLLANVGEDQRETSARTMGELCRKLGEKILGEIVPILRAGAESADPRTREGVCLALSEVLENTTDNQREGHEDGIIAAVRICLVDDSAEVRVAAARAFDVLQEYVGTQAIDQTIPTLLEALRHPGAGSGTALQALREIMTVRATTVFPVLIPTLIATPITAFNAHALASLVTVAGSALSKRLSQLLTALTNALETEKDDETREAVRDAITALVTSIDDVEGLHALMMLLIGWCKNESPIRRASGLDIFAIFCENTELDFSQYRVDWIRQLVTLLDDRESVVFEASWRALDEFVKSIDKSEMEVLVVPLRRTIESTGAPGKSVPGFGFAKGIGPMLPIIFAGLTTGSNEQREQAALSIADLVERTAESAIRPYTTQLTGPLIRVITQATTSPPAVKSAILAALTVMLERIPAFVKPFYPQLQRTFVKSLTDASLTVRNKAVTALTVLMLNQPRVDPLITELIATLRSSEDAIAGSLGSALAGATASARVHVGAGSVEALLDLVMDSYRDPHDDNYNSGVAQIVGALGSDAEAVRPLLEKFVLGNAPPHPLTSNILLHTVTTSPQIYYTLKCVPAMIKKMQASIGTDQPSISRPAREVKEILRTSPPWTDDEAVQAMF